MLRLQLLVAAPAFVYLEFPTTPYTHTHPPTHTPCSLLLLLQGWDAQGWSSTRSPSPTLVHGAKGPQLSPLLCSPPKPPTKGISAHQPAPIPVWMKAKGHTATRNSALPHSFPRTVSANAALPIQPGAGIELPLFYFQS